MAAFKTEPSLGYWTSQSVPHGDGYQGAATETLDPLFVSRPATRSPTHILFEEFRRLKPSLDALNIGFSVSRAKGKSKHGRQRKPPYFACCYDVGSLAHVNVVAFYYPLIDGHGGNFKTSRPAVNRSKPDFNRSLDRDGSDYPDDRRNYWCHARPVARLVRKGGQARCDIFGHSGMSRRDVPAAAD
jgi:hypothetical protein